MFTASVFKISVVSLSGIMDETYAAKEAVTQWNQANASHEGKLFMYTDDPKNADVLIGVVGNRVENTELIDENLRDGRQALLFFNAYQDPKNTIASEHQDVLAYKESMNGRCFIADYNGASELNGLLAEQLDII